MDIMICTGSLLLGGLICFIKDLDIKSAARVAGIYVFIAWVIALYTWIFYFTGIKDADLLKVLGIFLQVINMLAHAVPGYLMCFIILHLQRLTSQVESDGLKAVTRLTRWAISISIANTFFVATAGKSQNMPYMLDFFRQSGYATWFLYFIMIVEPLGALGILLHYKLKTGLFAACGLVLIMLGAVYTHWHNREQFSDSHAAVIQILNLSILLFVYYLEKQISRKHPLTPIYII